MVERFDSIQAIDWQPALGQLGEVVTDADDIEQCIRIILGTPKGSSPHRPEFGSDLYLYLDRPLNQVAADLVREAIDALEVWEPRIKVERVHPQLQDGHVEVEVTWRPSGTKSARTLTVVSL